MYASDGCGSSDAAKASEYGDLNWAPPVLEQGIPSPWKPEVIAKSSCPVC